MTLEEAAKQFRLPLEHLEKMRGEGLLSDPLSPQELNNLAFLRYFWRKPRWLKMQMSKMNHKARLALIRTAGLSKIESYVFNRYFNAAPGERHRVESIARELNYYYGIPVTGTLIRTIYAIRRKAENARHFERRKSLRK
jgi:hypothetical protein